MAYDIEKTINTYGLDRARELVLAEGLTQVQLHQELKISNSPNRLNASVYCKIMKYLGIREVPYSNDIASMRKLKLEFDRVSGEYWESEYIVDYMIESLISRCTINVSGDIKRYVISFPKHPKANTTSNQIKAHIILWEIINCQYVPEDCWVAPVDGNYLNLDVSNWVLVNISVYKSKMFTGVNNPAYVHGLSLRPKLGGWGNISKTWINDNGCCEICNSTNNLVVHYIINYHLFSNPVDAHNCINLMTLCRECHGSLHGKNFSIKALIEETQYSKLLELLETLKSQVPDAKIEILLDVEKQLGLTDNQQPSS